MRSENRKTLCVHGAGDGNNQSGAVAVPIYQSATFAHPGVGQSTGYDYSRSQNPTREALEKTLAALEGGVDAIAFASGMAAFSVAMELFAAGEHIVASRDLYGGSVRYLDRVAAKNGLETTYVNTRDLPSVAAAIRPGTRAIFVETPTNPMMHVTDIRGVARLAKEHRLLLIVDNTFLTPYFQRPLELGADLVLHSGTKYLGGHNDTLAGFLVTNNSELAEKLRFYAKTIGAGLAPFDCFLIQRGIKTLALRMERSAQNAQTIAEWLTKRKEVTAVHYAGLPDHPDFAVSKGQSDGFGGMISFEVDRPETARRLLSRVRSILYAESLGGVETLITYPLLQTHADVPEDVRNALGITDRLLRLSVGIEAVEDLLADLEEALT
jgi:cystathionine beta-lyase/cystathionine gamma-synthase